MAFNAYSVLVDLAFASGFILIGQLLRSNVKVLQDYFMPASLIAGVLGFIFGPSVLKLVPFSSQMGSYSGLLIIIVFVSMGIRGLDLGSTAKLKENLERLGSFLCFRETTYILQYTLPILFASYGMVRIWPDLHPGFGFLLGAGWAGGPGTAVAVGTTFAKYGWADATDLGVTSATFGILTGVFGGMALIKWATRNGITNYISDSGSLPLEYRTGLLPRNKRGILGEETIAEISLDTLALHAAILLLPSGLGYLLAGYIGTVHDFSIPSFSAAFMLALLFSWILDKIGAKEYIDYRITGSIAGFATDYLVFFGLASIKLSIIIKYAAPLATLLIAGGIFVVGSFLYLAPRMNKYDWFERGMFVFGFLTGVYANSFVLSRIVDPEKKSKTFEDTAICAPLTSPTDILVLTFGPILLSTGQLWTFLTPAFAYMIFFFGLAFTMKWWYGSLPLAGRKAPIANEKTPSGAVVEPSKV
ncbi:MAG: sodium/glutamate symporter [Firmicutes bacterium]|nr:sodium/glutamate symporter [Bacillota bacterium]